MFGKHPSKKLQQVFSQNPYQIQKPEKAKIIFLGLDANYEKDIEQNQPYFKETLKYLENGVEYWKSNGFHTPMLNENFNVKDGKRYHKQFRKLGFSPADANKICFLELLNICTYGSSTKNKRMFREMLKSPENKAHLERIRNIFNLDNIICISKGVKRIIENEKLCFNLKRKNIIIHTHFSGAISNEDICDDMRKKINKALE